MLVTALLIAQQNTPGAPGLRLVGLLIVIVLVLMVAVLIKQLMK
jgi:hypothetical protein